MTDTPQNLAAPDTDAEAEIERALAHLASPGSFFTGEERLAHMVERGGGRFIVTASAAGLTTGPVSFNYAVSKHAAVGVAEWLASTTAHRSRFKRSAQQLSTPQWRLSLAT